ncbi:hypothetical protein Tco_0163394 [Tanacetum coccineum]
MSLRLVVISDCNPLFNMRKACRQKDGANELLLVKRSKSIQTFLTDWKNLATASRGKKKTALLLIPNVKFTKLIIHHLRTKHNIHPRTGSPLHYSHDENILNTLRFVGKDGREIFRMPIPDALLTDESLVNDQIDSPIVILSNLFQDIMADLNIPANDVPVEQALVVALPIRTDDQLCRGQTSGALISRLDEQWFNLHEDLLRDALDITPTNNNNPFVAPPSSDIVIDYVNTLEYPSMLRNVFVMSVNALYQPWRAVLSMINMCLTGKIAGYDRPRYPVLQILWGITHCSNIDYAERIWEEFVQSIQTFLTDRKNLATASRGKKKTALLLIINVRFTKLIIHHLRTKHNIHPRTGLPLYYSHDENVLNTLRFVGKDGREIFGMPIPDALLTNEIKGAPYYSDYQEHVAKSKAGLVGKRRKAKSPLRLIDEPSDEGVPVEEPAHNNEEAHLQRALELKVQGKGKEKVVEEQAAHDLLTLQTPKKKSPTKQFIFQRRPPMPTKSSTHAESPYMDAELNLTDSEIESNEEASKINARNQEEGQAVPNPGVQDEGQAGPNPGVQNEGQARPNPGIAAESQLQSSHVVHAGPNLKHMDLGTSDALTQQKPKQMDEEFTTTAYPNVQENLKLPTEDQLFVEKPHEEEPGKTNSEAEVQSMVSVPIHQDTSSVPPTTTLAIDLTTMQYDSPLPTSTTTTSIITTTTSLPPPPQPQ